MTKLRSLRRLDAPQRAEIVDQLVEEIESGELFANQLVLLIQFCDILADTDDRGPAVAAINKLLPKFRASDDPDVVERLPRLEGVARRLELPGNQLELEGTFVDGSALDWSAYRGKVVLVDFWATECGPCLAEIPVVLENYRKYHDKGFDVLGISLDADRSDVEQIMREANIPWQTLFHPRQEQGGWDHPMATKYGVIGIPRAILVDQQGNVVHMNARGQILGEELQRLLGEPAVDATSAVESPNEKKTALSEPR
jgi:thiol-disulfide isomerase/thioredoxin